MFEMVVLQVKRGHQLTIVVDEQLIVDHWMQQLVEKRNLYHQNRFHSLKQSLLFEENQLEMMILCS